MSELHPTPGQTIGPFFGYALPYDDGPYLVSPGTPGAVQLTGRVLDAAGMPVPDALVEIWQPDAAGTIVSRSGSLRRDGHTFTGFGRAATDNAGRYSFTTVRPGPTAPGQAPFFAVSIFARGLLDRLLTRLYLPVEDAVLAEDPLLSSLPEDRRSTVIAQENDGVLHWDIRLSGAQETVFLAHPTPS